MTFFDWSVKALIFLFFFWFSTFLGDCVHNSISIYRMIETGESLLIKHITQSIAKKEEPKFNEL